MKNHNPDNPVYDMENAVAELYKVADMAEMLCKLLKDASAALRKQEFIEGYKEAVGRSAGNGCADNGGT